MVVLKILNKDHLNGTGASTLLRNITSSIRTATWCQRIMQIYTGMIWKSNATRWHWWISRNSTVWGWPSHVWEFRRIITSHCSSLMLKLKKKLIKHIWYFLNHKLLVSLSWKNKCLVTKCTQRNLLKEATSHVSQLNCNTKVIIKMLVQIHHLSFRR